MNAFDRTQLDPAVMHAHAPPRALERVAHKFGGSSLANA